MASAAPRSGPFASASLALARCWGLYPIAFKLYAFSVLLASVAWASVALVQEIPEEADPHLTCQLSGHWSRLANSILVGAYASFCVGRYTLIFKPSLNLDLTRLLTSRCLGGGFFVAFFYAPLFVMVGMSFLMWMWMLEVPACEWENKDLYANRSVAAICVSILNAFLLCWHSSIIERGEPEVPDEPAPASLVPAERESIKRMMEDINRRLLQSLDTIKYDPERFAEMGLPQECSICLLTLDAEADIKLTTCGHAFHEDCFRTWLQRSRMCPVCRQDVVKGRKLSKGSSQNCNASDAGAGPGDLEWGSPQMEGIAASDPAPLPPNGVDATGRAGVVLL